MSIDRNNPLNVKSLLDDAEMNDLGLPILQSLDDEDLTKAGIPIIQSIDNLELGTTEDMAEVLAAMERARGIEDGTIDPTKST